MHPGVNLASKMIPTPSDNTGMLIQLELDSNTVKAPNIVIQMNLREFEI